MSSDDEFAAALNEIDTTDFNRLIHGSMDVLAAPCTSRFATVTDEQRSKMIEDSIPTSTRRKEQWAVKIFF